MWSVCDHPSCCSSSCAVCGPVSNCMRCHMFRCPVSLSVYLCVFVAWSRFWIHRLRKWSKLCPISLPEQILKLADQSTHTHTHSHICLTPSLGHQQSYYIYNVLDAGVWVIQYPLSNPENVSMLRMECYCLLHAVNGVLLFLEIQCLAKVFIPLHFFPRFVMLLPYAKLFKLHFSTSIYTPYTIMLKQKTGF